MSALHKIFCTCSCGSGSVLVSDDSALCYILPVLWMTSCFHVLEHIQITSEGTVESEMEELVSE